MKATLFFDGACMQNPGGIGAGVAILKAEKERHECAKFLEICTNNEAEYTGIIAGLERAVEIGIKHLECFGDSQLVINQLSGKWGVKSENLQKFWKEARQLASKLETCKLTWIPREKNAEADELCDKFLQSRLTHTPSGPVGNLRKTWNGIRCDRKTALGNPFEVATEAERRPAIEGFRQYLWLILQGMEPLDAAIKVGLPIGGKYKNPSRDEFMEALQKVENSDRTLLCWCHPLPCHCDVLHNYRLWKRSLRESANDKQLTTAGNTSKL